MMPHTPSLITLLGHLDALVDQMRILDADCTALSNNAVYLMAAALWCVDCHHRVAFWHFPDMKPIFVVLLALIGLVYCLDDVSYSTYKLTSNSIEIFR